MSHMLLGSSKALVNTKSTSFDGTDDFVTLGEPADLIVDLTANELTIAAWIYPTDTTILTSVVSKSAPGVPTFGYILGVNTSGGVYGYWGGTDGNTFGTNGEVTQNAWNLIGWTVIQKAGVYTGQIWINGAQTAADVPLNTGTHNGTASGIPVIIGAANAVGGVRRFKGRIEEVSFWNAGFAQAQWTELYNKGKPTNLKLHSKAANLLHWYRMGDGDTFPTVTDNKGSSSGTCTNMVDAATNFVSAVP